ncbi:RsmB/NOP family class I SAM-dependent RNA methyltransferase [Paenibacillus sp. sgz302251]|uniref:RsmB/NOP family class I SAM-dependent RNA methyltransferase n=1 Tax=Paenibacillus sp. sgz302251 TaxID=3414493 RepID=UPI003C7C19D4
MIGNLPLNFTKKMKILLGNEFDDFMASYDAARVYGLRINRLKLNAAAWRRLSAMGGDVRPIPWAEDGVYYPEGERPGKHPHYHAGLYYIQEPSAMAPVELLDVQPGHRVLDLCAAPGGKSTQIAGKLQGKGVLVTNDNARERTKALAKNIELAGVRNAVVLNEEPAALAPVFHEWFDRILVDAPCSGEGMFRKDESMIAEWEKHSVERCSLMQRDILHHAAGMLAPGGLMVYSTCTFSPEENEEQIAAFLAEHPDFQIEPVPHRFGWTEGRADLAAESADIQAEQLLSIKGTVRLWPHLIEGEGHYAAVLRRNGQQAPKLIVANADFSASTPSEPSEKDKHIRINTRASDADGTSSSYGGRSKNRIVARGGRKTHHYEQGQKDDRRAAKRNDKRDYAHEKGLRERSSLEEADPVELWKQEAEQFVAGADGWPGQIVAYGSRIYIQPTGMPKLDGLRVVRAGWYVGEARRDRIEPSHPLAMGLTRAEAVRSVSWSSEDPQTLRYLKGETLFIEDTDLVVKEGELSKGYVLICTDGFPIGWGKYAGGMIKNELPAGWRWM